MPTIFRGPTTELDFQQYSNHAFEKVDSILDRIIAGDTPMANDLNVFSDVGEDILNPPTEWARVIIEKLEPRVDRAKAANLDKIDSKIRYYQFSLRLRERGGRATILFSYTAALPR